MIKFTVTLEDGKGEARMEGAVIRAGEVMALFKCIGVSMARLLEDIPHDVALACIDELMSGMEEAKQEEDK